MLTGKPQHSVLIVSGTDKVYDYITNIMPKSDFSPVLKATRAGEAKRELVSGAVDIVIINTPLPDEFGTDLALDLSADTTCVMLLVKNDKFDEVSYKVEDYGVLTVAKPCTEQTVYSSLKLMWATSTRLCKLESQNRSLKEKMADIRTVNRAKWLLIENHNMTESEAHYYIEKQAMDTRLSRREVAQNIIRTYDK